MSGLAGNLTKCSRTATKMGEELVQADFQRIHAFSKRSKADKAYDVINDHLPFDDMTIVALRIALKDIFSSKKRMKSMLRSEKNIGGVVKALSTAPLVCCDASKCP